MADNYSGSTILFDLPALTSSKEYFERFMHKLEALGYVVSPVSDVRGNCIQISKGSNCALVYFQGAGSVHWWAFQKSVVAQLLEKAQGCPVYLMLSGIYEGGEVRYFFKTASHTAYPPDASGREMVSGDTPKGFAPLDTH